MPCSVSMLRSLLAVLVAGAISAQAYLFVAGQLSLLHRNPYSQAGDSCLLCACLLWAALLPSLGARWSVANPSAAAPPHAPLDLAALGLKLQIALFYGTTAIIKMREGRHPSRIPGAATAARGPSPWLAGTAVGG